METTSVGSFVFLTVVAPAAWGTTYIVTEQFLPPTAALRGDRPRPPGRPRAAGVAPPAALGHLVVAGDRARASCNIGLFFPLIFLAAYHLPGGLAATAARPPRRWP